MSEKAAKARADFIEAWTTIGQCLAAETLEERERLLSDAYLSTPVTARSAFTLALVSIAAEMRVIP